jgi:MFS family permease
LGIISLLFFPFLLLTNYLLNQQPIAWQLPVWSWPTIFASQIHHNFVYDLFYVYGFNYQLLFLLFAAVGVLFLAAKKNLQRFLPFLIAAALLIFNYLFSRYFIKLSFLTPENQEDFRQRLLLLAFYFLLPFFLYPFYLFARRSFNENGLSRLFVVFLLGLILGCSLYFSYPVSDDYKNAKGFTISQADLDTVRWLDQHAPGDYVVLANQLVGAAAIREFGWRRYYGNDFYYSLPNGRDNLLYQYFLKMIGQEPKKETAQAAMTETGVDNLYFIVNSYWINADRIIAQAKLTADSWQEFGQGTIDYVFYYHRQ